MMHDPEPDRNSAPPDDATRPSPEPGGGAGDGFAPYSAKDYDVEVVATWALGEPEERAGWLYWRCPFHDDPHPSLTVYANSQRFFCFGCKASGSSIDLLMHKYGLSQDRFREAKDLLEQLVDGDIGPPANPARPAARKAASRPARGRPSAALVDLQRAVEEGIRQLHGRTAAARDARRHLREIRGLNGDTIAAARIGFSAEGMWCLPHRPRGYFLPWYHDGNLVKLVQRLPDDLAAKLNTRYMILYQNHPICYPSLGAIRPGLPLVVCEGEFDTWLLAQLLGDRASVITLGSATNHPLPTVLEAAQKASRIYVGQDDDEAGKLAAEMWPGAIRTTPPGPHGDWGEAWLAGCDLVAHWTPLLEKNG